MQLDAIFYGVDRKPLALVETQFTNPYRPVFGGCFSNPHFRVTLQSRWYRQVRIVRPKPRQSHRHACAIEAREDSKPEEPP